MKVFGECAFLVFFSYFDRPVVAIFCKITLFVADATVLEQFLHFKNFHLKSRRNCKHTLQVCTTLASAVSFLRVDSVFPSRLRVLFGGTSANDWPMHQWMHYCTIKIFMWQRWEKFWDLKKCTRLHPRRYTILPNIVYIVYSTLLSLGCQKDSNPNFEVLVIYVDDLEEVSINVSDKKVAPKMSRKRETEKRWHQQLGTPPQSLQGDQCSMWSLCDQCSPRILLFFQNFRLETRKGLKVLG